MCHECGTIAMASFQSMSKSQSSARSKRISVAGPLRRVAITWGVLGCAACGSPSQRDGAFAIMTPDGYSVAVANGSGAASVSSNGIATSASVGSAPARGYAAYATYTSPIGPNVGYINGTGAVVAPVGGWYPFYYASPLWAAPVPQVLPMTQPPLSPYTVTPYFVPPQ